jgi:hypothetical protein
MSQEQVQVAAKTQQMLQGPLKHVRAAALAAALVPLASVMATPASAQVSSCASGGFCGLVWEDTNNNGVQDAGEPGIPGAVVTVNGTVTYTDDSGFYFFPDTDGTFEVVVQIPPGTEASPSNAGSDDTADSDGVADDKGNSIATFTFDGTNAADTDFGFHQTAPAPGTGTPGYWKNHPDAWPAAGITVGGVYYPKATAISWLEQGGKDKTSTMFSSLASAMLNVMVGNNSSCVATTIAAADAWMMTYPLGSKVAASSYAWKIGEPMHRLMDNYNNGMLCAPHRD